MVIVFKDCITKKGLYSDALRPKEVGNGAMVAIHTIMKASDGERYYGPGTEEYDDGKLPKVLELVDDGGFAIMDPKPKKGDFTKKIVKSYIKKLKKVLDAEKKADFVKLGTAYIPELLKNYKKYEVLSAPFSDDGKVGMCPLLEYAPDGMSATLYFWKHGVYGEKY